MISLFSHNFILFCCCCAVTQSLFHRLLPFQLGSPVWRSDWLWRAFSPTPSFTPYGYGRVAKKKQEKEERNWELSTWDARKGWTLADDFLVCPISIGIYIARFRLCLRYMRCATRLKGIAAINTIEEVKIEGNSHAARNGNVIVLSIWIIDPNYTGIQGS